MDIRLSSRPLAEQKVDLGVCFAHEGDSAPRGLDKDRLGRELAAQMKADGFRGRKGDRLVWAPGELARCRRVLVVGLGKPNGAPDETVRYGCTQAARRASDFSSRSLGLQLPVAPGNDGALELRAAVEGALLGAYRFDRYLTDASRRDVRVERVEIAGVGGAARLRRASRLGQATARAVCLARDLVNEGPSRLTPDAMARQAAREARGSGLSARVLGKQELEKIGLKALLAVSRGSAEPPRVVHLVYRPSKGRRGKPVVLVGKGVTFDSGGMNLKPSDGMRTMKGDMAGAAAVLAAMTALGEVGCRVEVHGLLGLTENMTGGAAYKPGDILDTFAGKTVEVGNTDAEGRLVLCDLLAWAAKKLGPAAIVDMATLTGACVVALGPLCAGVFCRHDGLRSGLLEAGRLAGEKLWPLPLYEEYLAMLQKGPADLCNVGPRWGGAITAALFLGEFLPRELPWAHLDIAGPAFSDNGNSESPEGGTGAGVRTLVRWLESL